MIDVSLKPLQSYGGMEQDRVEQAVVSQHTSPPYWYRGAEEEGRRSRKLSQDVMCCKIGRPTAEELDTDCSLGCESSLKLRWNELEASLKKWSLFSASRLG